MTIFFKSICGIILVSKLVDVASMSPKLDDMVTDVTIQVWLDQKKQTLDMLFEMFESVSIF